MEVDLDELDGSSLPAGVLLLQQAHVEVGEEDGHLGPHPHQVGGELLQRLTRVWGDRTGLENPPTRPGPAAAGWRGWRGWRREG